MALITNTHTGALALPGGAFLRPGVPTPVPNWEELRSTNHIVSEWFKAGVLVEARGSGAEPRAQQQEDEAADAGEELALPSTRKELVEALQSRGVHHNPRWPVSRLQETLADSMREEEED